MRASISNQRRERNYTYLFDTTASNCPDTQTHAGCAGVDGGLFNEAASTTYSAVDSAEAAREANDLLLYAENITYGSDTLKVNTTLSLSNFPFGVRNRQKGDLALQNWVGLGRNSIFLHTLVSKGVISSRTYAFWAGQLGTESLYQTDGDLVLGGYDSAKISGSNITLPFTDDDSCPSGNIVTITDIKLDLTDGSTSSILGPSAGSALKACVVPTHAVLDLPEDIWSAFVAASGVKLYSNTSSGRSFGYGWLGWLVDTDGS